MRPGGGHRHLGDQALLSSVGCTLCSGKRGDGCDDTSTPSRQPFLTRFLRSGLAPPLFSEYSPFSDHKCFHTASILVFHCWDPGALDTVFPCRIPPLPPTTSSVAKLASSQLIARGLGLGAHENELLHFPFLWSVDEGISCFAPDKILY
jgi:hypothetical protein